MSIFTKEIMIRLGLALFLACLPAITFAQVQGTPVNCYDGQFIFGQDLVVASASDLLFRATDNGWEGLSTPVSWHQLRAVQDKILYLYNDDTKEVFRSTDRGATWQKLTQLPFAKEDHIGFYPSPVANVMMLSVYRNTTFPGYVELYRSIDDGVSWQRVHGGGVLSSIYPIIFSPAFAQDRMIFANVYGRGTFGDVLKSIDSGQTWFASSNGVIRGQNNSDSWLIISPQFAQDQTLFVAPHTGGISDFYKTVDAGVSWQRIQTYPIYLVHAALSPTYQSDQTILMASRGLREYSGIYLSQDVGASLQRIADYPAPYLVGIRHAAPLGTIPPLAAEPDTPTIRSGAAVSQTLEFWAVVKPDGEGNCRLYRSIDQGQSWVVQTLFETPYAFYLPVITQAN